MLILLSLIPWALTVIALVIIIVRSNKKEEYDEEFFFDDEENEETPYQTVKVAVYEDKAYWVIDNIFYESDIIREPDFTTARPIDTMSLTAKELNKLLSILDDLEESNERD